jgi:hypothetical protein
MLAKKPKRQPKKKPEKPVEQAVVSVPESKETVVEFDFFLPYCGIRRAK